MLAGLEAPPELRPTRPLEPVLRFELYQRL